LHIRRPLHVETEHKFYFYVTITMSEGLSFDYLMRGGDDGGLA
jgi:hypothetical protein